MTTADRMTVTHIAFYSVHANVYCIIMKTTIFARGTAPLIVSRIEEIKPSHERGHITHLFVFRLLYFYFQIHLNHRKPHQHRTTIG